MEYVMHCSLITLAIAVSFFTISNGSAMQDETNNKRGKSQHKLLAKTHESLSQTDDEMDKALRAVIERHQTVECLKPTASIFSNRLNKNPALEKKLIDAIRTNPKLRAEIVRFLSDQ